MSSALERGTSGSQRESIERLNRRMPTGTNRKTHELAMRQDGTIVWTPAPRLRLFPTDYGHVALRRAIGVTCVYQSDSSSKRPVASVAFSNHGHAEQRLRRLR